MKQTLLVTAAMVLVCATAAHALEPNWHGEPGQSGDWDALLRNDLGIPASSQLDTVWMGGTGLGNGDIIRGGLWDWEADSGETPRRRHKSWKIRDSGLQLPSSHEKETASNSSSNPSRATGSLWTLVRLDRSPNLMPCLLRNVSVVNTPSMGSTDWSSSSTARRHAPGRD